MCRARAQIVSRSRHLCILKLGFQRGDLDLDLLDETVNN